METRPGSQAMISSKVGSCSKWSSFSWSRAPLADCRPLFWTISKALDRWVCQWIDQDSRIEGLFRIGSCVYRAKDRRRHREKHKIHQNDPANTLLTLPAKVRDRAKYGRNAHAATTSPKQKVTLALQTASDSASDQLSRANLASKPSSPKMRPAPRALPKGKTEEENQMCCL